MKLDKIGYNHIHGADFAIDVPVENSWWLFLLVKTSAVFFLGGREVIAKPNSFIIYTQGTEQHYRANGSTYADDWFHLLLCEEDASLFEMLQIPLNVLVELPDANDISMTIRSMAYEFNAGGFYTQRIQQNFLEILFLKISRQLQLGEGEYPFNPANRSRYDELLLVRNHIFEFPQKPWSIDMIADFVSLSRSTIQHEYKKAFGTSVSRDVIAARVNRAKHYLFSTTLTVGSIAELCGYNSTSFFIRQFKSVVGKSPTEYRAKL